MKRLLSVVLIVSISGISLVVTSVAVAPGLVQAQQPIRIGATMSETGSYATQGVPARAGYLLCQKHVNEKGGLLGRKVEFLIYDDKSNSKTAVALYEKLIVEDKGDAVRGPYGSTLTEAVAPVTEKHRQVLVSPPPAPPPILGEGGGAFFFWAPTPRPFP